MSSSTGTITATDTQVATVMALTTTFTPPTTCSQMHLTQLEAQQYRVWLNEPMPVPNTKFPECYPTEFIGYYTSALGLTSSIAPMMSPLVAPVGWVTVKELDNGYIVLCPSNFELTPPKTTVDSNRPAYGGSCYSNFSPGVTYTATGYNNQSLTGTVTLTFTSGDQAFAHVIEGHKMTTTAASTTSSDTSTSLLVATQGSSVTNSASAATATSDAAVTSSASISGGAIAGAVVGSVAGVALIFLAIFFLFRRRRGKQAAANDKEMAASTYPTDGESGAYQATVKAEKDLPSVPPSETAVTSPSTAYTPSSPELGHGHGPVELPEHPSVYEMESPGGPHPHLREMDGGWQGTELGDNHHGRR